MRTLSALCSLVLLVCVPSWAQDTDVDVQEKLRRLEERIRQLEGRGVPGGVDLSEDAAYSLSGQSRSAIQDWYEKVRISGFGSFGFIDTGNDGKRPDGGFVVHESTLFVEAEITERAGFTAEIQLARTNSYDLDLKVRETYVHFRELFSEGDDKGVGVKVGRFDLPFGDQYLREDAHENPLVTYAVAHTYGWDEGVLVHGESGAVRWILAVTDGAYRVGSDDTRDKAVQVKLYGNPHDEVDASISFLRNGKSAESAFCFDGANIKPVGSAGLASTRGASTSSGVDSLIFEVDLRKRFGSKGHFDVIFGQAAINDDGAAFDRDILWLVVEALYRLNPSVYFVVRHSEIGTFSSRSGYAFEGKPIAGGTASFGFDTSRLARTSLGVGWQPNSRVTVKLEVAEDDFDLIDGSPFDATGQDRLMVAGQVVVSF